MHWTTALSRNPDPTQAIEELSKSVLSVLEGPPDLLFLFASDHYRADFNTLPSRLTQNLACDTLIGCSASGVISNEREVEFQPAMSLVAASLPDVRLDGWHIEQKDLGPGTDHSRKCALLAEQLASKPAQFIVLADPFTFPTEQLLHALEGGFEHAVIAGGLASGAQGPGETALFLNGTTYHSGALVLSLSGDLEMGTAVAQGCRPIGEPLFITALDNVTILELDGQPPLQVLHDLYVRSDERDRHLMQHSLFLGTAMRPGDSKYDQGDFLIRNLMGADRENGTINVATKLYVNQVVQFHVRDAKTSAEDLDHVLNKARADYSPAVPAGAVLFSCTGRGEGLYGESGHDSASFHKQMGEVPLGGFFCNGEIGQVEGKAFLHGYTSCFALFQPHTHKRKS